MGTCIFLIHMFVQNAAERIAKGSAKRGFQPCVYAMDSYNIQTLPDEELVVFVAATTGDGDTPNSMVVCCILHGFGFEKTLAK